METPLYKFNAQAASDVIMLGGGSGRRVLEIMGKAPGPQGTILPAQMAVGIAALQAVIAEEGPRQSLILPAPNFHVPWQHPAA